jgi:hypothetical protein
MLSGWSKRFRLKAAAVLAALYAVCVLAPHAALAVTQVAAHCLTDASDAAHMHAPSTVAKHVHADGSEHDHGGAAPERHSDADGKTPVEACCGVFCVTALPHEPDLALATPLAARQIEPGAFYQLAGRGPDRINRPPIG